QTGKTLVADFQLSLRANAGDSGQSSSQWTARSGPRREAAVHQSRDWRITHALDRGLCSTAAGGFPHQAISLDRCHGLCRRRRRRPQPRRECNVRMDQPGYFCCAVLVSRHTRSAGRDRPFQLFRSARAEGPGDLARTNQLKGRGFKTYLRLGRVSNLPTVWTNFLAVTILTGAVHVLIPFTLYL